MNDQIRISTDLFEHKEVKAHFINPCCFGEDLAAWLSNELSPLRGAGFRFSDPIQEDYGWGLWVHHGADPFWIALSYCEDGPTEDTAEWVVSVSYDPGVNFLKRLFHRPNLRAYSQLRDAVWRSISSNEKIRVTS
jgi:hypothetical protein